ncbi:MAG: Fe2+-dependent dioxygenase [Cyanobacteriota bacterium]|nr:Fe2+-dependent dioxygenase [Cyanobacteriota bacterium]
MPPTALDLARVEDSAPPPSRPAAMQFLLEPLLPPPVVEAMRQRLREAPEGLWRSGVETAGWHARTVKHNRQLDPTSALHGALAREVVEALQAHPLVRAAAFPRRIHGLLFSRMGPGERYGRHVDNAWMAGGRADLSFTLALTDPDACEGGDLLLETPADEERIRLPAGHGIVYPSTRLHQVEPVVRGERLVAVGWIESRIRHGEQRELLFELDTARRTLFARDGTGEVFDLISRSYSNLLRWWDA